MVFVHILEAMEVERGKLSNGELSLDHARLVVQSSTCRRNLFEVSVHISIAAIIHALEPSVPLRQFASIAGIMATTSTKPGAPPRNTHLPQCNLS